MSVGLPVRMDQSASTGRIVVQFDIGFIENLYKINSKLMKIGLV